MKTLSYIRNETEEQKEIEREGRWVMKLRVRKEVGGVSSSGGCQGLV
jgi:hypothetical protein